MDLSVKWTCFFSLDLWILHQWVSESGHGMVLAIIVLWDKTDQKLTLSD
jgi:hypothetical protein